MWRQGRGPGRLRPAQFPGAGAAGREPGGAQRRVGGALPGTPGRPATRSSGEHRRAGDRAAMLPLPAAPHEACETRSARVSSLSLVRYRGNDYSVPVAYGHREVLVRGYVEAVVIACGTAVIAPPPPV